jgi:hypothetical protein
MRATRTERIRAEQVSAAVDQLIGEPNAQPEHLDPEDARLLDTARQLAQLPTLLGPADRILEQQVMRQARTGSTLRRQWMPRFRLAWAAAGLVALLLALTLLTPLGETAVASFMSVFRLGRTEVRITPVDTPAAPLATVVAQSTAISQSLTLAQARTQVPFTIPQPGYLPPGYNLHEVVIHTYPDLPSWVPQPFSVDLVYGDGQGHQLSLGLYLIMLSDRASISQMNLEATPIKDVQDVDVNGQPGVLLQLGAGRGAASWQEVVWEQGDLILALSAADLSEAELLRIARSVQ